MDTARSVASRFPQAPGRRPKPPLSRVAPPANLLLVSYFSGSGCGAAIDGRSDDSESGAFEGLERQEARIVARGRGLPRGAGGYRGLDTPGASGSLCRWFRARGDRVAAVAEDKAKGTGQLRVWDVATGRQVVSVTVPDRPLSLAFAPDGTAVATGGWNGTVMLWDTTTGRVLRSFSGHSTPVRGLAFLPDGHRLAAGASDGQVILWDVASGREQMRLDRGHRFPVNGMAISHDGRYLAAAGGLGAGAVSLWDLEPARPLKRGSLAAGGEPIAFAPDRAILAARATGPAGSVNLVDLDSDRVLSNIPVGWTRSLAFSPDSRLVAIGGDDEAVTVRDVGTGRLGCHLRRSWAPAGPVG